MSTGDLTGVSVVVGCFLLVVLVAEAWARRGTPPPEYPRKLVHLGGVVPCVLIPFLIESAWVVAALAVALAALLALATRFGLLRSLSGVGRRTHGAEFYPLAVLLAYLLAADRAWLYVSAILCLGVADTCAALTGASYGRIRYGVEEETKSLEGSVAFLVVTFLAVHLPMLLMTDLPRETCVLASLLTAVLVTGFEAISVRGLDNLLVPIGVCVVVDRVVDKPAGELVSKCLVLAGLLLAIGLAAWRARTFNVGAALVMVLFSYAAWALASWVWALPPLVGLAVYALVRCSAPPPPGFRTQVRVGVVSRAHVPPLLLLAFAHATGGQAFLMGPYMACYAAVVALSVWTYLVWRGAVPPRGRRFGAAAVGAFVGSVVPLFPGLVESARPVSIAGIAGLCLLLSVWNDLTLPRSGPLPVSEYWPAGRFLLSCAAPAAMALLQWAGFFPLWPQGSGGS